MGVPERPGYRADVRQNASLTVVSTGSQAEEGTKVSDVVQATRYRTQVWMAAEGELHDLTDRTNSALAGIEAAGGRVERIEILPTPVSANTVLYTAVVIFQERLGVEED